MDHLASISPERPGGRSGGSYYRTEQYLEFAQRTTIFEGVIASTISDVAWIGAGEPMRLRGNYCSMNTFEVMGVAPLMGRATIPADEAPGGNPSRSWAINSGNGNLPAIRA